jgi:hypothetical protein
LLVQEIESNQELKKLLKLRKERREKLDLLKTHMIISSLKRSSGTL